MRQRAAESDVVIVNHHLLCADAAVRQKPYGEVIPSCDHAIIDEAHQLEDVATQYFGRGVSNYRVEDLARDRRSRGSEPDLIADREKADDLRTDVERLRDHARKFFWRLQLLRFEGGDRMPAATRASESARRRHGEGRRRRASRWCGALDALEADIALAKDASEDVLALARRAGEMRDDIKFLLRADDPATSTTSRRAAAASSCAHHRSTSPTSSARCCSIG